MQNFNNTKPSYHTNLYEEMHPQNYTLISIAEVRCPLWPGPGFVQGDPVHDGLPIPPQEVRAQRGDEAGQEERGQVHAHQAFQVGTENFLKVGFLIRPRK